MNNLLTCALVAWLIFIPWMIAGWFSPQALLWLNRRLFARAHALKASRALYAEEYRNCMDEGPAATHWPHGWAHTHDEKKALDGGR